MKQLKYAILYFCLQKIISKIRLYSQEKNIISIKYKSTFALDINNINNGPFYNKFKFKLRILKKFSDRNKLDNMVIYTETIEGY